MRGPGTGYKRGTAHHCTRHAPEKVEVARILSREIGLGDINVGYLLNVSRATARDWRTGRMRKAG